MSIRCVAAVSAAPREPPAGSDKRPRVVPYSGCLPCPQSPNFVAGFCSRRPTTVPASSEKPGFAVCWEKLGWGGRIRTCAWRHQKPLPYRLATPQHVCGDRRAGRHIASVARKESLVMSLWLRQYAGFEIFLDASHECKQFARQCTGFADHACVAPLPARG